MRFSSRPDHETPGLSSTPDFFNLETCMPNEALDMGVSGRKPEVLVTHREGETRRGLVRKEASLEITPLRKSSIFEWTDQNGREEYSLYSWRCGSYWVNAFQKSL